MTTSDGSSSRTVDVTLSSDTFKEIKLRDLELYRSLDPSQPILGLPVSKLVQRDEQSGAVSLSAVAVMSLTNGDVVRILEKIEKIVMNNADGMEYKLNSLFTDKKDRKWTGPSPGTLRIFGPDRVCFYTGRNWRRIRLNKVQA
jgi:hypothetical protein